MPERSRRKTKSFPFWRPIMAGMFGVLVLVAIAVLLISAMFASPGAVRKRIVPIAATIPRPKPTTTTTKPPPATTTTVGSIESRMVDWWTGGTSNIESAIEGHLKVIGDDATAGNDSSLRADCGFALPDIQTAEGYLPAPDPLFTKFYEAALTDFDAAVQACSQDDYVTMNNLLKQSAMAEALAGNRLNDITSGK